MAASPCLPLLKIHSLFTRSGKREIVFYDSPKSYQTVDILWWNLVALEEKQRYEGGSNVEAAEE